MNVVNSLHADLARASIDARRAEASARRLATETTAPRRNGTRAPRGRRTGRWLLRQRRRGSLVTATPSTPTTPWPHPIPINRRTPLGAPAVLDAMLALVAERIVEHGTASEARLLRHLSGAVRSVTPGAAAALVDWNGAEVARQRAFGVVHGVVLADLDLQAQTALLDEILGTGLSLAG
ncbi:MAG: hypothetical protein ABWX84_04270 [Nocardioides sp.]